MASVWVLYIDDKVVGPHLELLRGVCEPESQARPHLTVRYFDKLSVPPKYRKTVVSHIDVLGPGLFGAQNKAHAGRTVYLGCRSEQLAALEHKPHYPTSELHTTVYDGASASFGERLLSVLREFRWCFRVPLPAGTSLSRLNLKPRRPSRKRARRFSKSAKQVFHEATSLELTPSLVKNATEERRLELCEAICQHLELVTADFERVEPTLDNDAEKAAPERGEGAHETEIFLTPPELAQSIAALAVESLRSDDSAIDFGDPAVGTGAFYSALLQVISPDQIRSAIGIEVNASHVAAAERRWSNRGMTVMTGDYLHMEKLPLRSLILANPPYSRHQSIELDYKEDLRERASVVAGTRVGGRAGLYVYFLLLTHSWMQPGAIAGWLLTSAFLRADYGDAVRRYLTETVELLRLHQFSPDSPQFENAKVLPAVLVLRNRRPTDTNQVVLSFGATLENPEWSESISIGDLRRQDRWHIPLRRQEPRQHGRLCVGDLFSVRRGIATGANDFFVMTRARAAELGLPPSALRPLLPKARTLKEDVVEREADGYPKLSPQLCLLDCGLSMEEITEKHSRLREYLDRAEALGVLKRNLVRHRKPWHRQEQRSVPRFLCTYMGRGNAQHPPFRFIWNKSDAVATNTYLFLYPRPTLAAILAARSKLEEEVFTVLRRAASETVTERARIQAGGLQKIEPSDLKRVRLLGAPRWLQEAIDRNLDLTSAE